jgi:hypothetical protein
MEIDPKKIKVVIQKYNSSACEELHEWLEKKDLSWRYGVSLQPIAVGRNQNVKRFLDEDVPKGYEYLLMVDDDMVPLEETEPILTAEGDLLYCAYPNKFGGIDHWGDGTLCSGFIRMSAKLLQQLKAPYFRTGHSGDLMQYTGCDCNFMKDRASELEIQSKMVGVVGHLQKLVLMCDPTTKDKWIMKFRHNAKNTKKS